ncbi:MAG: GNAT family protein [Caulobacteraceae bacterium]
MDARPRHFVSLKSGDFVEGLALTPRGVGAPEIIDVLSEIAAKVARVVQPAAWFIVEKGEVIGLCSILSLSPAGDAEIGYGISPDRQGRGAASGAVAAVVAWAKMEPRIRRIVADTGVDNVPPRRVLERNGFSRVGERQDKEDGPLSCWALDVSN